MSGPVIVRRHYREFLRTDTSDVIIIVGSDIKEIKIEDLLFLASHGRDLDPDEYSKCQVPIEIWEAARTEAHRRGYRRIGERWEKD